MTPLVLRRVTKQWPNGKFGLRDVSLEAMPSTLTAIIGHSGAGKTTLAKTVAGLIDVDSGELQREPGQPVMVFQEDSLWPHMTLLKNVSCPLHILKKASRAEAEHRAIALLEEWGLGSELQNYPAQLSGGQRQRGALARAWLMEPKILVLDEITSGLDPENTAAILKSILALKSTETILLMVTHQLNFARAIADQVIFMADGGRVIEKGTAKEVLEHPKDPRVARFIAAFDFSGSQQCE